MVTGHSSNRVKITLEQAWNAREKEAEIHIVWDHQKNAAYGNGHVGPRDTTVPPALPGTRPPDIKRHYAMLALRTHPVTVHTWVYFKLQNGSDRDKLGAKSIRPPSRFLLTTLHVPPPSALLQENNSWPLKQQNTLQRTTRAACYIFHILHRLLEINVIVLPRHLITQQRCSVRQSIPSTQILQYQTVPL